MTDTQGKREGGKKKIGPLHGPLFSWTKMMRKIDYHVYSFKKKLLKAMAKRNTPSPLPPPPKKNQIIINLYAEKLPTYPSPKPT